MILIDGEIGGGQILRTSLSLSMLTKKPFKIINIRKIRKNPGLQHQHLVAVNASQKVCNALVKGNFLHSTEIEFTPGKIEANNYIFDIGTAGSTTLVLQTLLPALLFAVKTSKVEIIGGTENPLAPPSYDFEHLFLSGLRNNGVQTHLKIIKHGYYPKGGGKLSLEVNPVKNFSPINITNIDEIEKIDVHVEASLSLQKLKVAERILNTFKLNFKTNELIHEHILYSDSLSPGCFIHAHIHYKNNSKIGLTILGEKYKLAEEIGKEAAVKLQKLLESKAPVDEYTADQLLIYMALKPDSKILTNRVTEHIKTNIEVIERFLSVKFKITNNIIECIK